MLAASATFGAHIYFCTQINDHHVEREKIKRRQKLKHTTGIRSWKKGEKQEKKEERKRKKEEEEN